MAPEQHPGSLPLPLHTSHWRCGIMGGIASSPAAARSRRLLRQTPKTQQYHRPPVFLLLWGEGGWGGGQEPLQLQGIQVFLPPAAATPGLPRSCTYLTSREQSTAYRRHFKKKSARFAHWVNSGVNSSHMRSLADFGGSLLCT